MKRDDGTRTDADAQPAASRRNRWSRRVVQVAMTVSAVGTLALVGGFTYGTYAALGGNLGGAHPSVDSNTNATKPSQPSPSAFADKTLHLVALGDSLTHGFGDASGQGYVGDVSQQYRNQGHTVIQSNLGIDGLTSGKLLQELKQPSVRNLLENANVILVSIGGNDLNDAAGLPDIHTQQIATAESQFSTNLTSLFAELRKINGTATVALIGLYNPYGDDPSTAKQTDGIVQTWVMRETQIAAAFPNTIVVQTFDLFHLHPSQFLYVDHFHPNQTGYQRIADRVWQDLQES